MISGRKSLKRFFMRMMSHVVTSAQPPRGPPGWTVAVIPGLNPNEPNFYKVFSSLEKNRRKFPCVFKTRIVTLIYFKFLKKQIHKQMCHFSINLKARTNGEILRKVSQDIFKFKLGPSSYLAFIVLFKGVFIFYTQNAVYLTFQK